MLEAEHQEEMAEQHSGYDKVTHASTAVQSALATLKMMKDADANEELISRAQQKLDVLVQRWMDEMDPN
ncbi:hypothetical protein V7S43_008934 [Phytophthora oleae]|uniref:Uncharacterized protein n=1 Tax=Phytophthora oleae TaxID=2107226 RepID=A0ABD3FKM9_9STRA